MNLGGVSVGEQGLCGERGVDAVVGDEGRACGDIGKACLFGAGRRGARRREPACVSGGGSLGALFGGGAIDRDLRQPVEDELRDFRFGRPRRGRADEQCRHSSEREALHGRFPS